MKVLQAIRQLNHVGAAKQKMNEIFVYACIDGVTLRYPVEAIGIRESIGPGIRANMDQGQMLVDGEWKPASKS